METFNFSSLQQKADQVIHNADEAVRKWQEFISAPAGNVNFQYYDRNGNLQTATFPNRNKVVNDFIANVNSAMQKTFYVDAVNGDNNNDGSQTAPFKTLGKVASESVGIAYVNIVLMSDYTIDSTNEIVSFWYNSRITFNSGTGVEKLILINSLPSTPLTFYSSGDVRFNCEVQAKNTYDPTISQRTVIDVNGVCTVRVSNLTVAEAVNLVAMNDGGVCSVYVKNSNIITQEANGHIPFRFAVFNNGSMLGVYVEKGNTTIDGVQPTNNDVRDRIGNIIWRTLSSGERIPINVLSNCTLT